MAKNKLELFLIMLLILITIISLFSAFTWKIEYDKTSYSFNILYRKYYDDLDLDSKYSELTKSLNNLEFECPDCSCDSKSYCYVYDDSEFDLILKDNANEVPYILNYYDCTEFSNELKNRLNNVGFKTKTKVVGIDCDLWTNNWDYLKETYGYGYDDCKDNNLHQIVEINKIYVEATSGEIIMPYEYEKYGLN